MPRLASPLLAAAAVTALLAGCRSESYEDFVPPGDFGPAPVDSALRVVDGNDSPPDIARPPVPDFAVPPVFDFAVPPPVQDFAQPPVVDMAVVHDLAQQPDFAGEQFPARHPVQPQIQNQGGSVIAHPNLISVTWPGDGNAGTIDNFVSKLPASTWWTAVMTEWGVGAGKASPPVHIGVAPGVRLDDTQIQAWLQTELDGKHAEFGKADPSGIYILSYPAGTVITESGHVGCVEFGGYHKGVTLLDGTLVAYAVIPRCNNGLDPGVVGIDIQTSATSHEVAEAASDPDPLGNTAWAGTDLPNASWEILPGGENGDMCALWPGAFYLPNDLPNKVQRIWSNKNAKADLDPCVPVPAAETTYFNSAPVWTDRITYPMGGGLTVAGVRCSPGQSRTVEVDLFSSGPTAAWTVSAIDVSSHYGGPRLLSFAWDKTSGVNGDKLHLTINCLQNGGGGWEAFEVLSTLGGATTQWVGVASAF